MSAYETTATVDVNHHVEFDLPPTVKQGRVRALVLAPDIDEADENWGRVVANAWSAELADPREDLYSLSDGTPDDETR